MALADFFEATALGNDLIYDIVGRWRRLSSRRNGLRANELPCPMKTLDESNTSFYIIFHNRAARRNPTFTHHNDTSFSVAADQCWDG